MIDLRSKTGHLVRTASGPPYHLSKECGPSCIACPSGLPATMLCSFTSGMPNNDGACHDQSGPGDGGGSYRVVGAAIPSTVCLNFGNPFPVPSPPYPVVKPGCGTCPYWADIDTEVDVYAGRGCTGTLSKLVRIRVLACINEGVGVTITLYAYMVFPPSTDIIGDGGFIADGITETDDCFTMQTFTASGVSNFITGKNVGVVLTPGGC